ncbi:MAG TPA: tail fiber protein, partial [Isosphaeraceae bacterium]|nr:tail fiber protein [Isosphaeraceae bacterium]
MMIRFQSRNMFTSRAGRLVRKGRTSVRLGVEALEDRIVLDNTLPIGGGQPIDMSQPALALNYIIAFNGVFPEPGAPVASNQPYVGEVLPFAGQSFEVPGGWALCSGQLLSIAQYPALFSVLGTTYGGNGVTNFALPDLQGRTPVGAGQGPGLPNVALGQELGTDTTTLSLTQIPAHSAPLANGGSTGVTGGSQSVNLQKPSLGLNFIIAEQGTYPSPDNDTGNVPVVGEIRLFAGEYFEVPGGWGLCDGQLLSIDQNLVLFSVLGTTFGGNGTTNFALPDLRGREAIGVGQGAGLPGVVLGQDAGSTSVTLNVAQLPVHNYPLPPDGNSTTGSVGGGQSFDNEQPALGLNYIISENGSYPDPSSELIIEPHLGDIRVFAGESFQVPGGWALCDGQVLSIEQSITLFSVLGTTYGGDGKTTFALPDLQGRTAIGAGQGAGLPLYVEGDSFGQDSIALTINQLPSESLPLPVLALKVTADKSSVNAGSTAGFTVTVNNTGPSSSVAAAATLSDPLPALGGGNLWSINTHATGTNPGFFTLVGAAGSQVLEFTAGAALQSNTPESVDVTGVPMPSSSPATTLTTTATLDSPDVTVHNVTGTATITVHSQEPVFANLSSATINYGTPTTTFSGTLEVGASGVADASVSITLNSVVQTVTTDSNGHLATMFNTGTLGVAGSPYPVTYAFAGNSTDGPATDTSTAVTVTKAHLTVTAVVTPADIGHGDAVPTPTATYSGFVNGDTAAVISGSPTFSGLPSTSSPAGIYTITPSTSGLSAANYDFPYTVSATLNVHPQVADILVKWGSQTMSILNLNRDLPFVNITGLEVKFTDPVDITGTGLSLTSTAGG